MDRSEETPVLPCAEKLAFDSREAAQATATTTRYQRGIKLKLYRCAHCSLWHLATDYQRER